MYNSKVYKSYLILLRFRGKKFTEKFVRTVLKSFNHLEKGIFMILILFLFLHYITLLNK